VFAFRKKNCRGADAADGVCVAAARILWGENNCTQGVVWAGKG